MRLWIDFESAKDVNEGNWKKDYLMVSMIYAALTNVKNEHGCVYS